MIKFTVATQFEEEIDFSTLIAKNFTVRSITGFDSAFNIKTTGQISVDYKLVEGFIRVVEWSCEYDLEVDVDTDIRPFLEDIKMYLKYDLGLDETEFSIR